MRFKLLLVALSIVVFSCDLQIQDSADTPDQPEPEKTEEEVAEESAEEVKAEEEPTEEEAKEEEPAEEEAKEEEPTEEEAKEEEPAEEEAKEEEPAEEEAKEEEPAEEEAKEKEPAEEEAKEEEPTEEEAKEEETKKEVETDPEVVKLLKEATEKKKREEANKKHSADFHYTQAKNLYAGNVQTKIEAKTALTDLDQASIKSLNQARDHLINALEYQPKHEKARALLTKISAYLGVPESKDREVTNRASQRRRARIAQIMAELNHDYNQAVKLLDQKKYPQAIKGFKKLERELEFVPYDIPDNDLPEKIAAKLAQAKAEKQDEKKRVIELQNRKARLDAEFALKRERQLYRNKIRILFSKAEIHYDAHEYDMAMKVSKQILKSDPEHSGAIFSGRSLSGMS